MTDTPTLADEIEALFEHLAHVPYGAAQAASLRFFEDHGPDLLSALRERDRLREALKQIGASCGPHDCEAAYWRCDAARQALTGEA